MTNYHGPPQIAHSDAYELNERLQRIEHKLNEVHQFCIVASQMMEHFSNMGPANIIKAAMGGGKKGN